MGRSDWGAIVRGARKRATAGGEEKQERGGGGGRGVVGVEGGADGVTRVCADRGGGGAVGETGGTAGRAAQDGEARARPGGATDQRQAQEGAGNLAPEDGEEHRKVVGDGAGKVEEGVGDPGPDRVVGGTGGEGVGSAIGDFLAGHVVGGADAGREGVAGEVLEATPGLGKIAALEVVRDAAGGAGAGPGVEGGREKDDAQA